MPPQPVEIDLPDLGAALWNVVVVLWSYVSHAFWAVWTYPPFEAFRNEFAAALIALWNYVVHHLIISAAIAVFALIIVSEVLSMLEACLSCGSGFRERGMLHGTHVVHYQSTGYGGNVSRDSAPARFQSRGAKTGGGHRPRAIGSSSWA